MKTVLKLGWQLFRYTLATCISIIVSALVPTLVASVPLVLAIVWVLAWIAAFLLYLLTGEVIDVEIGEPIGLIFIPLFLAVMGIATMSAAILLTIAFNLLIVLPFSLISEAIYRRFVGERPGIRLGIFLGAGVVLGIIVAVVGVIWVTSQQPEMPLSHQVGLAAFLLVTCICTEFVFGLTLTLIDIARKGAVVIRKQIKKRREGRSLPHPT
jgi:hypothetical protein